MLDIEDERLGHPRADYLNLRQVRPARGRIADEGDRGQYCYILIEGVLVQEKRTASGHRQIVGLKVAGDVCGLADWHADRINHSIVALSPVSYVAVAHKLVFHLARESSLVNRALWGEISRDAAISAEWIANLGQRPAYQRIAHLLCEIEARLRDVGRAAEGEFEWFGHQADLGAATGLSVVHVNKTLRRLEAAGLVSWGRRVKVRDLAKLRAVAHFDPAYLAPGRQSLGKLLLVPGIARANDLQESDDVCGPAAAPIQPQPKAAHVLHLSR